MNTRLAERPPPPKPTSEQPLRVLGRRPELDGIRGLALLAVFGVHLFRPEFPGGAAGVDIFFVLSGFLITAPLLVEWHRKGSISFRDFWMRRSLRLLPALAVFVPIAAAAALVIGEPEVEVKRSILASLGYFMNLFLAADVDVASTMAHTWSLSIEEQFYLVWPVVFVLVLSRSANRLTLLKWVSVSVLFFPLYRTLLYLDGATYTRLKVSPDTRVDMFAIGCLLAMVWCWDLAPRVVERARVALVPAGLFMVAVVFFGGPRWAGHLAAWGWSAIAVATAILILNALDARNRRFTRVLRWGVLGWLGRLSYGLYLWHFAAMHVVKGLAPGAGEWTVAAVTVVASLGLAALSWRYVELPFLDLKSRYAHTGSSRYSQEVR